MKKRLLSALLALALVFVLLPTTALAGEVNGRGDISIAGKDWNFTKNTSGYETVYYQVQSKSGVFSTSLENKTGCVYPTNPYLEITRKGNTITVIVHGAVTITTNKGTNNAAEECIEVNKSDNQTTTLNLVITGVEGTKNNTLTLECKGYGSALSSYQGDITITGGVTVNANSTYSNSNTGVSARAINVFNGDLTISGTGTTVNAENRDSHHPTIDVKNAVTISDGATLTAKNTSGDKAISFGSITADGYDFKYWTTSGYTTLTGEDKATNIQTYSRIKLTPTVIEKDSYVYIAGGPAVVGVRTSLGEGNGYYTYNKDTKTFTLENVNITSVINAIQLMADGTYTINLVGTNTISDVSAGIVASNLYGANDITAVLSGTGSLDITAGHYAIDMQKVGNLKFENTGTIKLTTGYKYPASTCNALYVVGNVTIDTTKYGITGQKQAQGFPTEDIGNSPVFETILKGTDSTLYFKTITIAPKPSKTYYNGTAMKYGETKTVGNGTISCDENGVITLNGVTEGTLEFRSSADSTLVLEGTNTLSSIVTTQTSLTISGSGSLTAGSIRVPNNTQHTANLTINGATVTVGTAELTTRAIDVNGSLTVTGASLTATSKSDSVPTVQVGGNASFTGSTVTITNNSTALHKDAADATKGDSVSSALYVKGNINITDNANVTAKVENGGGNAIGALGNITVNGSTVTAVNKGQKFTTIIAKNVYVSGDSKITANNLNGNPDYNGWYLAFPAIEGNIVNQNTDYSLKFEGQHNGTSVPKTTLAPGEQTTLYYYNVTITRGDEVTRTNSPVVIAGTTLLNDTYYTINGSTVAKGSKNDYNALYDSETKTLKLNNAKISTTTKNAAIKISEDLTITVTGTNELKGNYNHCIESYNNFTINGTGTLNMTNTSSSSSAASVIWCGPYKSLTIAAEVIIKNEAQPGNLIFTVEKDAYSFAEGYNVYASTDVSGSPLEAYDAAKGSTYKYLCITKENLAPTTPTTYTVTITAGDNMNRESGALTQEVTKGAAITEVKFVAASGHYFPADYVSKMNLPAGLTAEIRENSWYLIISGTPTSDVTINLPAASVRPTITVSMPTPAAGNTPATANDITLTYSDINKSISKNLTISNVVWQSYVSNGDGSITLGEILSNGDKFVEGTKYRVTIDFEGVSEDYAIVPAAGTTAWSNAEWGPRTMTLHFDVTGAACTHEYTNDWHANGNTHWHECKLCRAHADEAEHTYGGWITDTEPTATVAGTKHRVCSVCDYVEQGNIPATGEIVPPTPDNPGTIVIIRPAEEEKPAQQPNPSTGANDLVGMAVAAAVAAALGSAALLRKHD